MIVASQPHLFVEVGLLQNDCVFVLRYFNVRELNVLGGLDCSLGDGGSSFDDLKASGSLINRSDKLKKS